MKRLRDRQQRVLEIAAQEYVLIPTVSLNTELMGALGGSAA